MRKEPNDLVPVLRLVVCVVEDLARISSNPSTGQQRTPGPHALRALDIGRTWETGAALRGRRENTALIGESLRLVDAIEGECPTVRDDVLYPLWHTKATIDLSEAARLASSAGLQLTLPEAVL